MNSEIEKLASYLAKLPGLGPRSGRRAVLYLLKHKSQYMEPLIKSLQEVAESFVVCEICRNYDTISPCNICSDTSRQQKTLCIVEDVADLWAMERSNVFKGQYHVLGGTLSVIDGKGPEELGILKLIARVLEQKIEEVIIATNATIDGQTTSHYIIEKLKPIDVKVSQLAFGIPVGGELDYLDEGTLHMALKSRQAVGS